MKVHLPFLTTVAFILSLGVGGQAFAESYPIVDTGQNACFNNTRQIGCPDRGDDFDGQDAQYKGPLPKYRDNGDGTVTDLVTGLMWVKARGDKTTWQDAMDGAARSRVGGYDDWRAPTIKELYSLIDFNGWVQQKERDSVPFLDTDFFDFVFGDVSAGERIIDCQDWSSTLYVSTTMGGSRTAFGVNFADGRIKGYGVRSRGSKGAKFIRYVRGNPDYGKNAFVDNDDGTVEDRATGLTWQKQDSAEGMNWEDALSLCENLTLAGNDEWRLPSAKELQSIVDYSRSPKTTKSPALDPIFEYSDMEGWVWTSTTHLDVPKPKNAVYVAFGRATGYFSKPGSNDAKKLMDVHGAGAQRSDPKSGRPAEGGHGPQGDEQRVKNYVRCVAGGGVAYYEPDYKRIPQWKGGKSGGSSGSQGKDPNMGSGQQRSSKGDSQSNGQSSRRKGPPQAAFDACDGSGNGDACTVQTPRGQLSGMCRNTPEGIACVPAGGRPKQ